MCSILSSAYVGLFWELFGGQTQQTDMSQNVVGFRQSYESVVDCEREEGLAVVLYIPRYTAKDIPTTMPSLTADF
jgi:hypothetical protein